MNVFVLLKQTFDTEEKIRIRGGTIEDEAAKLVINPYDEYAVEEALNIRERHGGQVTVVSVGEQRSAEALRTALAMGADEAVLIEEPEGADEAVIADLLAAYLRGKRCDVLLGGHFSVDRGSGQVALRVAELLNLPHVGAVTRLTVEAMGGKAVAVRDCEGDEATVEVSLPACFTAQQGLNEPRYPTLPGIMKAKKKPFSHIDAAALGLPAERLAPHTLRAALSEPPPRRTGTQIEGEAAVQADKLVRILDEEAKLS